MKKLSEILQLILLIAFLLQQIYSMGNLPSVIATHWGIDNQANGYLETRVYILIMTCLVLGIYLLLKFVFKNDPKKENINPKYFNYLIVILLLFLNLINIYVLLWNKGYQFNIAYMLSPLFCLIFTYLGFVLPRIGKNYSFGIRTPWTLNSDMVWEKTHKLSKKPFITSGLISLLGIFFPSLAIYFILLPILLSVTFLFIYSYRIYVQEEKLKK